MNNINFLLRDAEFHRRQSKKWLQKTLKNVLVTLLILFILHLLTCFGLHKVHQDAKKIDYQLVLATGKNHNIKRLQQQIMQFQNAILWFTQQKRQHHFLIDTLNKLQSSFSSDISFHKLSFNGAFLELKGKTSTASSLTQWIQKLPFTQANLVETKTLTSEKATLFIYRILPYDKHL